MSKVAGSRRKEHELSGLELVNEAINLLRTAPVGLIAGYYIGSVPFILSFLYFWSDMSRSADAHQRCFPASLSVAALFIWMKCWQSVFASGLRAFLARKEPGDWTLARALRMLLIQSAVQPYGLLLIPLGMILMIPFYAFHAFFQNISVLADGTSSDISGLIRRAWKQARLWPTQNHYTLWLVSPWVLISGMATAFITAWLIVSMVPALHEFRQIAWFIMAVIFIFMLIFPFCPFGCIVAGNIALAILLVPTLLHMFFGIQTSFTISGIHGIFNTTFIMSIFGLSYLFLDPIIKAAHSLRCFYGDSRHSGEDLLVELRELDAGTKGGRE